MLRILNRSFTIVRPKCNGLRYFATKSNDATKNLVTVINDQIRTEKRRTNEPEIIKEFLSDGHWAFTREPGSVDMFLKRSTDKYDVTVQYNLVNPLEGGQEALADGFGQVTDFSITVGHKDDDSAPVMVFYCSTFTGNPPSRFMINNIQTFQSRAQLAAADPYSYRGPAFETLPEELQLSLDVWLAKEVGIQTDFCDFIDATAVHAEQVEYIQWLEGVKKMFGNQ